MNHAGAHEDDEPLIPLMDRDNGQSSEVTLPKQKQGRHSFAQDDVTKSAKLSGSTVHDSISETEVRDQHHQHHQHQHHHHHHHDHDHESHPHKDSTHNRLSLSSECEHGHGASLSDDDDDDEPLLLESQKTERDKRRLKIAIGLCGTFFVVELLGGIWSDSLALLSDSFHLLTGKSNL